MVPVRGVNRSACCCLKGARAVHSKIICFSSPTPPLLQAKQTLPALPTWPAPAKRPVAIGNSLLVNQITNQIINQKAYCSKRDATCQRGGKRLESNSGITFSFTVALRGQRKHAAQIFIAETACDLRCHTNCDCIIVCHQDRLHAAPALNPTMCPVPSDSVFLFC